MSDRGVSDEELVRLLPGDFRNGSAEVNGTRAGSCHPARDLGTVEKERIP
jgi:hypothetical protein